MNGLFTLLGEWAWFIWALTAITFLGGSLTLSLFLNASKAHRWTYGLVVSGIVYCVVFALVGMQAGVKPFIPPASLLPLIRLFLLIGSAVGLCSLMIYWFRRRTL